MSRFVPPIPCCSIGAEVVEVRFRWWVVGILIITLAEAVLVSFWFSRLPQVEIVPDIRDVAMEMRRTIIQLDGVLIGFAGLIGTMIFTRPIGEKRERREVLLGTLVSVFMSVCLLVVSIFLAMYSLSYIYSQSATLVDFSFLMSAMFLVCGVDALGVLIAVGSGA
jgi:hypothetical protein